MVRSFVVVGEWEGLDVWGRGTSDKVGSSPTHAVVTGYLVNALWPLGRDWDTRRSDSMSIRSPVLRSEPGAAAPSLWPVTTASSNWVEMEWVGDAGVCCVEF